MFQFISKFFSGIVNPTNTSSSDVSIQDGSAVITDIFSILIFLLPILTFVFILIKTNNSINRAKERLKDLLEIREETVENLEKLQKEQDLLNIRIKDLDKLSKTQKDKIDKIIDDASKKINKILNEESETKDVDIRIIVKRIQNRFNGD